MKKIIFILTAFFIIVCKVRARSYEIVREYDYPDSITISSMGNQYITYSGSRDYIEYPESINNLEYKFTLWKFSSYGPVICTSGDNCNSLAVDTVCTKQDWSHPKLGIGVGYILDMYSSYSGNTDNNYYFSEMLVNNYLNNYNIFTGNNKISSKTAAEVVSSANSEADRYDYDFEDYYYNRYPIFNQDLIFVLNSDGYYYLDTPIYVYGGYIPQELQVSNSKFEIIDNYNEINLRISQEDISIGSTETVELKIPRELYYPPYAQNYSCGDTTVTLFYAFPWNNILEDIYIGSVTRDKAYYFIKKKDISGEMLPGVKYLLQTEEEHSNNEGGVEYTTTDEEIKLEITDTSKVFYLTEVSTLDNYIKDSNVYKISFNSNGELYVNEEKQDNNLLEIDSKLTKLKIGVLSGIDKSILTGSVVRILDENKENISCLIKKGNSYEKLDECVITIEDDYFNIYGLPEGKYYIKQEKTKDGYALDEELKSFNIKNDGTENKKEIINDLLVDVPDTLSTIQSLLLTLGMLSIALGIYIIIKVTLKPSFNR